MTMEPMRSDATIRVRAPRFEIDESVPRAWCAGNYVASHAVNALSLLFPEGERFFIRSVKHYLDELESDPALRARVRGFFGQEGRHGHEHDRFNRLLEQRGLEVESFLRFYRRVAWETIEPSVPPHLRLATTAALEHMTATLAELALGSPILEHAHPEVRAMLYWHACEEIEHKSVAYDVLERVDPRYRTRLAGLGIGAGVLFFFFATGFASLLWQERRLPEEHGIEDRGAEFARVLRAHAGEIVATFAKFARREFHPDDQDNYELARAHLATLDGASTA